MAAPSPGYSLTLRVQTPASITATSELAAAVGRAGGDITALDVTESHHAYMVVDVSCNTADVEHGQRVRDALDELDGVNVRNVSDRTFLMHLGGKLEVVPKVALRNRDDLSRAYTPGVARVCKAIAENPADARNLTVKRNTIAVVTDGSAVLGLGNIGPAAALPVMEGKAALFKQFADVDAWPVCLDTQDSDEIVKIVKALAPVYGGVNLEDIAAPRCFEIEARLREELDIPVFHDDQHGTAIVTLAALQNALLVVGKSLSEVRIVVSGVGAAGNAIIQLLAARGDQRLAMVQDWIAEGEVMAFGISEPGNDAVLFDSKTTAEERGDGSVAFTGTKIFTSLAPAFTRLGVFGKNAEGQLVHGFVARGEGVESLNDWNTLGMRASQSHTTKLSGAIAPAQWVHTRLAAGPNPDALVFGIFASFLTLTASVYVGLAERGLQLGTAALQRRVHQDGQAYTQDVRARSILAEAGMRMLTLDALQRQVAGDLDALVDHGPQWFPKLVTLRTRAGDWARENIQDAGQLIGGGGYFRGSEFERLYRDVQASWYHPSNAASAANTVASWLVGPLED